VVWRDYSAKLIIIVTCYFCLIEFTASKRAFSLLKDLKLHREVNILNKIDAGKPTNKTGKVNYMQKGFKK